MSDDATSTTSRTSRSTLIGEGGASPQDLVEMHRSAAQIYYAVAPSRLYAEPKRLEELGYVTSVKRPGKTRERTFYTLTPRAPRRSGAGRSSRRRCPGSRTRRFRSSSAATSSEDDAALLEGLLGLRPEIAAQSAKLDAALAGAAGLAHRERYWS